MLQMCLPTKNNILPIKLQILQQAHERQPFHRGKLLNTFSSFLMSRNTLVDIFTQVLVKTKATLRFGGQKHTLSKLLTLIVANFHDFRKLFDLLILLG